MPWYIPAVGLGIYGFGSTALGNIALVYLVDSYRDVRPSSSREIRTYSSLTTLTSIQVIGDAYIGITFLRNAFGTVAAMCLSPWIDSMGLYNMTVMSGCLSIIITLLTIPVMIWGRRGRGWTATRYRAMAAQQFDARTA